MPLQCDTELIEPRRLIIVKVILLIVLCYTLPVSLVKAEPLLFVGSYFPFILQQQADDSPSGVAVDIINAIMTNSDQPFEIVIVPWKRAQILLRDGEADMLIGPYKTAERQDFIDYSSLPFYSDHMVFYSLKANSFEWQGNYAQLEGKLIGVPLGWTGGESFEAHRSSLRIYGVPELKNGFEMLVRKRVDLVLSNQRNALVTINDLNIAQEINVLNFALEITQGYFGFSKHHDVSRLKALFDQQLSEMVKNGRIKQINQKYGLEY